MAATLASGAYLSQAAPKASAAVNSTSFTFTDSAGTSSSARFYPAGSVRTGLVVYLDDNDHPLHDQDHDGNNPNLPGGLAGPGSIVEAATARGLDVVSVHVPDGADTWLTPLPPHARQLLHGALLARAVRLRGESGGPVARRLRRGR